MATVRAFVFGMTAFVVCCAILDASHAATSQITTTTPAKQQTQSSATTGSPKQSTQNPLTAGGNQQCCSKWQRYNVPISPSLAPPKDVTKPWQHAVRVGNLLFLHSVHPFVSFFNNTVIEPKTTYNHVMQCFNLVNQILKQSGCTFNNVHDVQVGIANFADADLVDKAFNDFCAKNGCSGFPWAGHLRSGGPFKHGITAEVAVQASNCDWPQKERECSCNA
ncbi:uncharacterized protein LOC129585202 [Paramacrobiotus metropolitanus]|uniref:uncharacterized protein LOC129585202 n=1 Tax=Paramacrobiotus metropolitanus TaxID=2943436 RepID=UPI0024460E8F|nr:uncharacterized protein LOC129585202 [Paramacrobiotus metropolitanus]